MKNYLIRGGKGKNMKLHPVTAILYSIMLMILILYFNNPIYILSLLGLLVLTLVILGQRKNMIKGIRYSLYTALLIIIINPIISQYGFTRLIRIRLPIIGVFQITLESILFGMTMGIKILVIGLVFVLYSSVVDNDDSFSFFSVYAHKLTLIFSMTLNIVHRLRIEITRVKNVMKLRGVNFNQRNIFKKVKSYYPVLKVIMISSLEGSLDRAEALYSKGYGIGKRSCYSKVGINIRDYLLNFLTLTILIIFSIGITMEMGKYKFYPMVETFKIKDMIFFAIINIPILLNILIIWGTEKWKPLK